MSLRGRMMQSDFVKGLPYRDQIRDIKNTYTGQVSPVAQDMQDALVQLLSPKDLSGDGLRGKAARMAASEDALMLLKALPAATGVAAAGAVGNAFLDDTSLANTGMDVLGMGAGAFGMHLGKVGGTTPAGRALGIMAGMVGGQSVSDGIQGLVGGLG